MTICAACKKEVNAEQLTAHRTRCKKRHAFVLKGLERFRKIREKNAARLTSSAGDAQNSSAISSRASVNPYKVRI